MTTYATTHGSVLPSYAIGETDVPLLDETIGQNLRRTVAAHPDREALVDVPSGRRWSYRDLLVDVDALASGLVQLGINAGDRIAVWAGNLPEWMMLQYATAEIGAILVTVNPAFRTRELGYVLAQSGARMLVAARELKGVATGPMIAAVRADCPTLELVTRIGDESWQALYDPTVDERRLVERRAQLSPDDPINIQYTSGTTGHPKGATLSHRNILNNAYFVGQRCSYTERERVCVPVPLFHTFGMVLGNLATTAHGGCVVYPAEFFDAGATLAAVDQERCTSLLGVPAMFLAELGRPDLEELRPVVTAYRHDGRLPLPSRGDEAGHEPDGDRRCDDRLRDDGDLAGLDPDTRGRLLTPAGDHRGTSTPPCRGQDRRPSHRRHGLPRDRRRAVHARVLLDAWLLARAGQDGRGSR